MEPTKPSRHSTDRLEYVDALRGFALIGVLGANLFIFSGFSYMTDAQRAALPTMQRGWRFCSRHAGGCALYAS
jgi:uncharacterized membrane protein YeiB